MMPLEPRPEDFIRRLAEEQQRMLEAHSLVYLAHSHRHSGPVPAADG